MNDKIFGQKNCVLMSSTTFVWYISYSKKNQAGYYHKVILVLWKVPVILVRFQCNLNFIDRFSENTHISNLMKICSVEAKLFHANGRSYRHTLRNQYSGFWNFSKASRNGIFVRSSLVTRQDIGLDINAEETETIFVSCQQDPGPNHNRFLKMWRS